MIRQGKHNVFGSFCVSDSGSKSSCFSDGIAKDDSELDSVWCLLSGSATGPSSTGTDGQPQACASVDEVFVNQPLADADVPEVQVAGLLPGTAWILRGVLTCQECKALILRTEDAFAADLGGEEPSLAQTGRVVDILDAELAAQIKHRIEHHLPATIILGPGVQPPDGVPNVEDLYGTWRLSEVRSRITIIRYPGKGVGHLGPHRDGFARPTEHKRSFISILGYLNGLPEGAGGATRFIDEAGLVYAAVRPDEPGMAVAFFHGLVHDGEQLTELAPPKWLFRSNIIYARDHAFCSED